MANYAALKATIDADIRSNGKQLITGPVLNGILTNILAEMGQAGFLFKGMAHPGDTPAASDSNLFYLAVEAGQYSGFDGRTVAAGQLVIFAWDGAWASDVLLDISGKANKNGDPAEAFSAFSMTVQSIISGQTVVGKTVYADKITVHNDGNNAVTDIVPGGQPEDIEVATPRRSGTLALQEDVDAGLEKKANVDGFYVGLTAGAAENLVGRGSVEAEYQGIRTSAGTDDIGVGAAMITKMQGASIVWNQTFNDTLASFTQNGATFDFGNGGVRIHGTLTANLYKGFVSFISGHKYFLHFRASAYVDGDGKRFFSFYNESSAPNLGSELTMIYTANSVNPGGTSITTYGGQAFSSGKTVDVTAYVTAIDLTLMFGATAAAAMTVEQVERMFPLPYYAYCAGRIRNNEATGIKTVGFNLYNHATGKAVLPGKYSSYPLEYEICGTFTSISFEDYAGNVSTPALTDGRFFNVDRPGVLTVTGGNDTDTLVHLVWSGWRNFGEPDYVYEPYWENVLNLNLKTITGKLNGEGASVVIYPDGLRGVDSAYDYLIVDADGYARTAVKTIDDEDMGNLNWVYVAETNPYFRALIGNIATLPSYSKNYICERYLALGPLSTSDMVQSTDNKCIRRNYLGIGSNRMFVRDTAYDNADTFRAAVTGIKIIYERDTPEVYTLDNPIYMGYPVDDFGTEAKLPVDDATLPTGPVRYEVRYPFNAVDTLRNLPVNYISKESMLAYLTARGPIDNGTWTMTWDAVAGRYDFTFTPNEE